MGQRPFVLEHARQVSAINPPATGRTADEMLGLTRGRVAQTPSKCICRGECRSFSFGAVWRAELEVAILASMATYEYRVTEAADGLFPVELWSSQGDRSQLIYKTRGFQTRELAEAWIVPVEDRSGDPPSPRSRVIYLKPRSSTFNP
jgi:hypothetical protein